MSTALDIVLRVAAVVLLFVASTVFFDLVHWLLHRMLASRSSLLRALAWPHAIHHRWIDEHLWVHWEFQSANVYCHLVLEYVTQLSFAALLWLMLPWEIVLGVACVQTVVFLLLLRERGLDLNHRERAVLEVAPPGPFCRPAYHALHHAYPNAFFSSYVKLVDALLGTSFDFRSLRIALVDSRTHFGRALRAPLRAAGATDIVEIDDVHDATAEVDVLVLCEPDCDLPAYVEPYLRAARGRQIPPEVWAVSTSPADRTARHYFRDRRLYFRPILVRQSATRGGRSAARAARWAVDFLRRGARLPRTRLFGHPKRAFLRTRPERPAGVHRPCGRASELRAA